MNTIRFVILCAMLCMVFVPAYAVAPKIEPDGSILLPAQTATGTLPEQELQQMLFFSREWQQFNAQHGLWTAFWNEATGTPHRAFGMPITIPGYSKITVENVQDASRSFLRANASGLKIRPDELKFVRASHVGNKWYVTYRQLLNGVEVLLSEVELRISDDARVFALGVDFYADAEISSLNVIPLPVAMQEAGAGLPSPDVTTEGKQFVLPIRDGRQISFHLVYEMFVRSAEPIGNYVAYVDAHTGQALWRQNRVRYAEVKGRVRGGVQLVLPTDPFVESDFKKQYVNIDGFNVLSDSAGRFVGTIASPATLNASLRGVSVDVNRADASDAFISMTVNPGDSVNILWDNANSHPAERDAFFNTNVIHDYITTLDPGFASINYSMPCLVNLNQTCNAFWDGTGINFFLAGGGCANTAQIADVVFHEYGHGINDKLYEMLGGGGMINGATHEGTADVVAAMIADDPRIGRGFFGPNSILRTIDNSARYPENVSSDPHITGLIIGGAFWDLRQLTSLETARTLSHFAKYGLPDDPDNGVAFAEWFFDTIGADDDDGDLTNGTPNIHAIGNAFNMHGIGSSRYFRQSFQHTPIISSNDTTNAFPVVFQLAGVPIPGGDPESVRVHYTTDNFQTTITLPTIQNPPGQYTTFIPAQPWGTLVRYYITAYDRVAGIIQEYPAGAPATASYKFSIGFQQAESGVLYASSQGSPSGDLYSVDLQTGVATSIGSLGVPSIQALAIRPTTNELYGIVPGATSVALYRLNPAAADAFSIGSIPVGSIRALAFKGHDTLYAGTTNGRLYRIVPDTWDTAFVGTAAGIVYSGLAFHPQTGELWASVRPSFANRDKIYKVNITTGQVTEIGATGDGAATPSIAFSPSGVLYGLKGVNNQTNTLITISTSNGAGDTVGLTGVSGLLSIAMRGDSVVTAVHEDVEVPAKYQLDQNYPNPFNPSTSVQYQLPVRNYVTLKIYNLLGQEVVTLVDGFEDAGFKSVQWNATGVASGVYMYKLTAGSFSETKKLVVLK